MKKKLVWCMILAMILSAFGGCRYRYIDVSEKNADSGETTDTGKKSYFSEADYKKQLRKGRIRLKDYQAQYQEDISRVQKNTYQRLKFDRCVFTDLPDSDSVSVLEAGHRGVSVEEGISIIKNWLADIGQEDMDLDKELRVITDQLEWDDSKDAPYCYPSVMEHKKELKSADGFYINTNSCFALMGPEGIGCMSDGTITKILGEDGRAEGDRFRADEQEIVAEGTFDEMASRSYELFSGKVSVREAADMVKKYFEAGTPFPPAEDIGIDIPYVSVFSLKDKYGYKFWLRRTYKNMPFAYSFNVGGTIQENAEVAYDDIMDEDKTAYVVNDRTVAAYGGHSEAQPFHALVEENEILGMEDAMELLDSKLADELQVQVGNVELAYCNVCLHQDLHDEKSVYVEYPCWALEGTCLNNDRYIRMYMDVLTGNLYMYTANPIEETDE